MRKRIIISGIIIFSLIFVMSYGYSYFKNRSIANKAIPVAEQFLKEQYGVDVEFYDYQVNAAYVTSTIILYGRIQGEEDKAFTIFVDYRTYKVSLALVPPDYDPPNLNN